MGNALIGGGGGGVVNSGDLTAVSAYVLKGKTYMGNDTSDEAGTGTMPNIGSQVAEVAPTKSVTISKGYHDGTGVISGASLRSQTSGTAVAGDIYLNKTLWVNGVMLTGSMPVVGTQTATLDCDGFVTLTKGYHNGNGTVTVNSLESQTSGTATQGRVLAGKTIWVNGNKITGTMANIGAQTGTLTAAKSTTVSVNISQGYHNGSGVIKTTGLDELTPSNATPAMVRSGETCWVNGLPVTGTMATQAATTITPGTINKTVTAGVYTGGDIVMAGSANLIASNIKKGVVLFGITGTWEGLS